MPLKSNNSRRQFLKESALALTSFIIVPRSVLGGKGFVAPSDRVNVGVVGTGGRGIKNILELLKLKDVQITAIADPGKVWKNDTLYSFDSGRLPSKKIIEEHYIKENPNYKVVEYEDFRIMLEKEKGLDAILCATPDNTHAYVAIRAMLAGKHTYCEKPLTHNIWEARQVRKIAAETGVATQMGNQLHSTDNLRKTVEYLRSGIIGEIHEAHAWVSTSRWLPALSGLPKESTPVPEDFDWDLWLGPTPWHAFNKAYTPIKWRDFWVFGNGAMGDFGCHDMDTATWAFNLSTPESVELIPAGNKGSSEVASYGSMGKYIFKEKGDQKALTLNWYSGGLHPTLPDGLPKDFKFGGRGALYVGDKGMIVNNAGPSSEPQIFPEKLRETAPNIKASLPRSKGHHREWIDAIKGGPKASSNFEYGTRLTEITLLGVLSLRLGGRKIFWDAEKMEVIGLPEANEFIREPVREGWELG